MACFARCRRVVPGPEQWQRQNQEQQRNIVYSYIGLDGKGKLVDEYRSGGKAAVQALIKAEWSNMLYSKSGAIKLVSLEDVASSLANYSNLLESGSKQTQEEMIAEFESEGYSKVTAHKCCWRLDRRGAVGETPLHILHLLESHELLEISVAILEVFPNMVVDVYEAKEYFGESALHIAIVFEDIDSVRSLVKEGASLEARASGNFFMPEDVKERKKDLTTTDYTGDAYYGEYPLAFAAALGNTEIYDFLLKAGANPNLQDSFGNTVLHLIVLYEQKEMYRHAVRHPDARSCADPNIKNKAGLTPLQLASKLGKGKIFNEILDLASIELWRYSNIVCSKHPLESIDSISATDGSTNKDSALLYIIAGQTDSHLDMLNNSVINQLLREKWRLFALRRFVMLLLLCLIHLTFVTVAVYSRPRSYSESLRSHPSTAQIMVRYVCESALSVINVAWIVMAVLEVRSQGIRGFLRNSMSAPAKSIFLFSCLLLLICVPVRFTGNELAEETILVFAVPGVWTHLLFFARGSSDLGVFITIFYSLVKDDSRKFSFIFLIVLVMFSQAFYVLFKDVDNPTVKTFNTPYGAFMSLFQMTLGEFKDFYDEFNAAHYPNLSKWIFVLFMILAPILLLNMLIAMMANTYHLIISKSAKQWKRQWAKIVIVLERAHQKSALCRYQSKYCSQMEDGKPALMVITSANKTRAKQRKIAVMNWKKIYHSIRNLIDKAKQTKRYVKNMYIDDLILTRQPERVDKVQGSRIGNLLSQLAKSKALPSAGKMTQSVKPKTMKSIVK